MPVAASNLQDKFKTADLEKQVTRLLEKAMAHMGMKNVEVSLVFVDDAYIRELNNRYREKDQPTDVLSFALREMADDEPEFTEEEGDELLGDIVISLETAARQAAEAGKELLDEVQMLAVHGFLHLIGFDHGDDEQQAVMDKKHKEIMALA